MLGQGVVTPVMLQPERHGDMSQLSRNLGMKATTDVLLCLSY